MENSDTSDIKVYKDAIKIELPSGKKVAINVSNTLSLNQCIFCLSQHSYLKLTGKLSLYISGILASYEELNDPLYKLNFINDTDFKILLGEHDTDLNIKEEDYVKFLNKKIDAIFNIYYDDYERCKKYYTDHPYSSNHISFYMYDINKETIKYEAEKKAAAEKAAAEKKAAEKKAAEEKAAEES